MRVWVSMFLMAAVACAAGCVSDASNPGAFDAGPRPDTRPACVFCDSGVETGPRPACEPLEMGRCTDGLGGLPCSGADGEDPKFGAMAVGEDMQLVFGPQSSWMFVLAARTMGIDPGDPMMFSINPSIIIRVTDELGAEVAVFRSKAAFVADPAMPGRFYNAGFWVVVERNRCMDMQMFTAHAILQDRNGQERCGEIQFRALCR